MSLEFWQYITILKDLFGNLRLKPLATLFEVQAVINLPIISL